MNIRNVTLEDIENVWNLEKRIEKEHCATKETLMSRFKMFPEGCYVAEENGEITGYIESCLWDKSSFETFDEIKDFPNNHNSMGKALYIIFLGVDGKYRRKGIGSELVRKLQKYAINHGLSKVQSVAGEGFIIDFYEKLGFKVIRNLPKFLPYSSGTLMEYNIK